MVYSQNLFLPFIFLKLFLFLLMTEKCQVESGKNAENKNNLLTASAVAGETKTFRKITKKRLSKFLGFEEEKNEDLENFGEQRCACGKYLLREMQKVSYGDWHFRVWHQPLSKGHGQTTFVYHAHEMPNSKILDLDKKQLKLKKQQCLALKSVLFAKLPSLKPSLRSEVDILNEFAKINAKHIIRLYAFKEIPENEQFLFLMELGEKDWQTAIMEKRKIWQQTLGKLPIEENMQEIFTEILEAVKEMHKLVIHLDLKPENMVYVKEADGKGGHKMTLKFIDFGSAEFIGSEINGKKEENVCKLNENYWKKDLYASPEQILLCDDIKRKYKLSTKSDIWSVGILLWQLLLHDPSFDIELLEIEPILFLDEQENIDYFEIQQTLTSIVKLYHQPNAPKQIDWRIKANFDTIKDKYPRLFRILVATLSKVPSERPSAHGLVDYLSKKCELKMPAEELPFLKAKFGCDLWEMMKQLGNCGKAKLPECDGQITGNLVAVNSKEEKLNKNVKTKVLA